MSTLEDHITGQAYWRSLEQQANSPELLEQLDDEFQGYDPEEIQEVSRRTFLKLAGASLALAGLTLSGCRRWPKEELAPFAARPEDLLPGVVNHFASMAERGGVAHPMLVASFDGRPIKVESHPKAGYATDIYDQALTLQQYDPERLRDVLFGKRESRTRSSWTTFEAWMTDKVGKLKADGGAKFAVLAEPTSSPTALRLKAQLKAAMPQASWVTYEPLGQDSVIEGSKLAFNGKALRTQYDVSKAKVIACFDSDFLSTHPSAMSNARGWAAGRKSVDTDHKMNRMYVVEPGMTVTGSSADERLPVQPSQVAHVLVAVANALGLDAGEAKIGTSEKKFAALLAKDLLANKGAGLVVAGAGQPADVHALVHAINKALGNLDKTVTYSEEPTAEVVSQAGSLAELVGKMKAGEIDTLVILGGNPVFDAPADLKFKDALKEVGHAIKLGLYRDETAVECEWALPAATNFESWGDGRLYDGTVAIQQPLILPLFNGRSSVELLASVLGDKSLKQPAGYDLVRETFKNQGLLKGVDFSDLLVDPGYASDRSGFEKDWRRAVHLGFVPGSAFKKVYEDAKLVKPALAKAGEIEIVFAPSSVYDGRFANSPWLQECPDPITKVTWDNPLLLSVPDMRTKKLKNADIVEIEVNGVKIEATVFGQPGQAVGTVIAQVGNGRGKQAGSVGQDVGDDYYPMRTTKGMGYTAAKLGNISGRVGHDKHFATTSVHHLVMGLSPEMDKTAKYGIDKRAGKLGKSGTKGNVIKEGSLSTYKKKPAKIMGHAHGDVKLQLFDAPSVFEDGSFRKAHDDGPEFFNNPHAWGMSVDLTSCIGCNACVVACQAENNIPTVGKEQVWRSREMHWLRTDTYFKGDPDKPEEVEVVHQPVACVQCENAPCEQVCPVAATVHDTEGLNTMVYNRCIGTRYCSNNCPYKVRRFNYFDYHAKDVRTDVPNPWLNMPDTQQDRAIDEIKRLAFNPDVTVRMRGVMEKCTYCTQRIQRAKIQQKNAYIQANNEGGFTHNPADQRSVPDGTIVTACQDACPTDCITFGDLNDPESKVSQVHNKNDRVYALLEELNHRPRTKYLAKIRNPHPEGTRNHDKKGGKKKEAKPAPTSDA
ncbi:MAG: TAT-variant-translocated molybdopterin oxidoreductase [Phycisphaeraceae bacterium]|nr:TAT-variant-translocated molybdopterin oxidoreductase [Phycisphaeraceae bacterium]